MKNYDSDSDIPESEDYKVDILLNRLDRNIERDRTQILSPQEIKLLRAIRGHKKMIPEQDKLIASLLNAAKIITIDDIASLSPKILKELSDQLDFLYNLKNTSIIIDTYYKHLDTLKDTSIINDTYYKQTLAEFDSKSNVVCGDTNYVQSNIDTAINPIRAYE